MKTARLLALPLLLAAATGARASDTSLKYSLPTQGPSVKEVEVTVPQPDLSSSPASVPRSVSEAPSLLAPRYGQSARLEFSASSWVPGSLTAPTHLADATAFMGSGIPAARLTFFSSPFARWQRVTFTLLGGIGLSILHRNGTFPGDDATPAQPIQENGYVVPVTLGSEAKVEIHGPWSAYGDLALMPVAAFTTHTIFVTEEGYSMFGLPLELSAGIANDLGWVSPSLRGIDVKAGIVGSLNTFGSSDFSGVGATAAVGISL